MNDADAIKTDVIDYDAKRRETGEALAAAVKAAIVGDNDFEHALHNLTRYTEDRGKNLANALSRGLNDFCNEGTKRAFLAAMSREHRTLQQSFTGLVFEWLKVIAAADYPTDGRNEYAQKIARKALANLDEYEIRMPLI